jgi:allantoinase
VLAQGGVPLLVHAELDCTGHDHTPPGADPREYSTFLASRPGQWEVDAIQAVVNLTEATGCKSHIVHLSCADAVSLIADAHRKGLPVTAETCPHYLTFAAEEIPAGDTRFKCAPPVRERENRERLWKALEAGHIRFVVSDHSPCTPDLKLLEQGDFLCAWGGISSLQFGLPVIWTEAQKRGFNLTDLTRWMCTETARFVGLDHRKGQIKPGYDADLVIWDPEADFKVKPEMIQHKHKITPYADRTLYGEVKETILRGQLVYQDGRLPAGPVGQPVLRQIPALKEA